MESILEDGECYFNDIFVVTQNEERKLSHFSCFIDWAVEIFKKKNSSSSTFVFPTIPSKRWGVTFFTKEDVHEINEKLIFFVEKEWETFPYVKPKRLANVRKTQKCGCSPSYKILETNFDEVKVRRQGYSFDEFFTLKRKDVIECFHKVRNFLRSFFFWLIFLL